MKLSLFVFVYLFLALPLCSQPDYLELFFDGADTTYHSMEIRLDTSNENIWQIGPPQKSLFNSAFSEPNVLVTDSVNDYPINNTSIFEYDLSTFYYQGITAVQWTQKLDIDSGDIAFVEFTTDNGATWINAFDSPYTYNFYGFEDANVDTTLAGQVGFSGTDTNWRDIWLCFDYSWMSVQEDSIMIRHTFKSDSSDSAHDGWMIDNFLQHITWVHTIGEHPQDNYIEVFPNPTSDRINISVRKENTFHIIEEIILMDASGKMVESHTNCPTKFFLNVTNYPSGVYFIRVKTNLDKTTKKIIIEH